MADRLMEILQGKYLVSPVRFEGMQRYETLEIPKEALREILYNAIAHKDYAGPDIQMHVYDNHIEVWNEGEHPEGYTEETLMGNHSSKPRNRNITNVMFNGKPSLSGKCMSRINNAFDCTENINLNGDKLEILMWNFFKKVILVNANLNEEQ